MAAPCYWRQENKIFKKMVVSSPQTCSEDQIHDFPLISDLFHWVENGSKKSTLKDIIVISNGKKVTLIFFSWSIILASFLIYTNIICNPESLGNFRRLSKCCRNHKKASKCSKAENSRRFRFDRFAFKSLFYTRGWWLWARWFWRCCCCKKE